MTDGGSDTENRQSWASDLDLDRQDEAYEEFHELADSYLDDGMHPEEMGMICNNLQRTFRGRAEYETVPSGERRLNFRLWEVIKSVEQDDGYELNWQSIAFVLEDMRDMARWCARREREATSDE